MKLSTKIALVMCALVIISTGIPANMLYWRYNDQLLSNELTDLERETEIQATEFVSHMDELIRDTRFLADVPPTQGIARAFLNNGIDPADGTTMERWIERLAITYSGLLNSKPEYMEARYFTISQNGKEFIRVQRDFEGQARAVDKEDLLELGNFDNVKTGVEAMAGKMTISPITQHRFRGELTEPHTPYARAAIPIFTEDKALFGAIVVGLSAELLFERLSNVANPSHQYYIVNENFAYMRHPQDEYEFDFEFSDRVVRDAREDFPTLRELDERKLKVLSSRANDPVVSIRRVDYGPEHVGRHVYLIVADSFSGVTSVNREVFQQLAAAIAFVLLSTLALGLVMSNLVTRPFDKLTNAVSRMNLDHARWVKPTDLSGEAAMLAQALEDTFESLKTRSEALQQSNRELEQFAYIASHDLQEPLRTITSFSELFDKQYGNVLDDRAKQYFAFITLSCERMRALIHGLLEYSRLGREPVAETVSLNELVEGIADDMRDIIDTTGTTLTVDPLPTLNVYAPEIRSLLQNLISNAIKYVQSGTPPKIHISASRQDTGWQFSVADNGLGIEPEYRKRIFLIFQRLHGQDEYEGTGIGLAICVKIVGLHQGRIWVDESPSGGSIFKFFISEI